MLVPKKHPPPATQKIRSDGQRGEAFLKGEEKSTQEPHNASGQRLPYVPRPHGHHRGTDHPFASSMALRRRVLAASPR